MHALKKLILKSFGAVVAALSAASLLALLTVLAGLALTTVERLDQYSLLNNFFIVEKHIEKPLTDLLRANIPVEIEGYDAAPLLVAVALLLLWLACEAERYRLSLSAWRLDEERRAKEAEAAAERERARMRAEIDAAEKAAAARARAEDAKPQRPASAPQPEPTAASQREQLLELYAQTKKTLEEQKKNLSFLAVDVVDSTGMKQGEDPALAERDFRQYKKLVERVITAHKGLKAAWTPDGVMICFASVQNAVQAAQDLIRALEHFNRSIKTIKSDFQVRCGINAGRVMFDDSVRMEEMTDRNIDIAGHMQKYAEANTIYIGAQAIEGMRVQFGFRPAQKQVDGCDVYEWRQDGGAQAASTPAA